MKYIIVLLLLTGCITQERCYDRYPPAVTTITETKTIIRDTTIYVYIKGDTVHDSVTVYVDKGGLIQSELSKLHTEYSDSWARVLDGRLVHRLVLNESRIASIVKGSIKYVDRVQYVKEVAPPLVTNELTGWQWFQVWAGRLMLASILVLVLVLIGRQVLKI